MPQKAAPSPPFFRSSNPKGVTTMFRLSTRATVAALLLATLTSAPAFAQGGGGGGGFRLPPLLMESTAFEDGGIVPQKYAGAMGVQPGFKFSNAPEGTVSYAIIFHDLD